MSHLARRVINISFAFALAFVAVGTSIVSTAHATPAGNNGTLKVHEWGTPSGFENNDPKICVFNFEGFGFDAGQDGYVVVEPQGGDSDTTDTVTLPFGPTDENGYDETAYVNDGGSGYQLDNGHYKATLYGKDQGNEVNLEDEKAKSKVFKVNCGETTPECNEAQVGIRILIDDIQAGDSCDSDLSASAACGENGVVVTVTNNGDLSGDVWVNGAEYSVPANDSIEVVVPLVDWKASVSVYTSDEDKLLVDEIDCTPSVDEEEGEVLGDSTTTPMSLPLTSSNALVTALSMLIVGLAVYGTVYSILTRNLAKK